MLLLCWSTHMFCKINQAKEIDLTDSFDLNFRNSAFHPIFNCPKCWKSEVKKPKVLKHILSKVRKCLQLMFCKSFSFLFWKVLSSCDIFKIWNALWTCVRIRTSSLKLSNWKQSLQLNENFWKHALTKSFYALQWKVLTLQKYSFGI